MQNMVILFFRIPLQNSPKISLKYLVPYSISYSSVILNYFIGVLNFGFQKANFDSNYEIPF